MPSQVLSTTENNFTKGLVTEFTGLNFPENAATDADNCTFTLVGDVTRRLGIDRETSYLTNSIDRTGLAMNTFEWDNVGGDGATQVLASQVGGTVYFFSITDSTIASPISNHLVASTISLSSFVATGGSLDTTLECQFASGNGYLFIFHPNCDPIYCTYVAGVITGNVVIVQIRDFQGVSDGYPVNTRPTVLTDPHLYNLSNQGWTQGAAWSAESTTEVTTSLGSKIFQVAAGIVGVTIGDQVLMDLIEVDGIHLTPGVYTMSGNVTNYVGTSMTINVTSVTNGGGGPSPASPVWSISPTNHGYITTWNTAVGSYPSNADVWWTFKNASNVFDPATQINNTTLDIGEAPKGHFVISAFDQQRDTASGISTITDVTTLKRPTNGTWFQGRIWYTGVSDSFPATGTANASTWTENIYFSRIIQDVNHFGQCYQLNDPTSETLFDLLPTDGGVIVIQGSGPIYKLFPIQNGMLVFAANGIWFITGSKGIGFSANDYTITKLSAVRNFSSTSYVDVQGLPYFWNEDGIYAVQPSQNGGLTVISLTYTTVDSYFADIPLSSKKYARGDYDPINYTVKWIFKDTEASSVTDRYAFNKILNYNTANKAFYPYTVDIATASINSIDYISGPGGSTCPPPAFKYIATTGTTLSFADEHSTNYIDWHSVADVEYESTLTTGYKLHGQAQRRFQMPYIYVYSRVDGGNVAYKVQGIWDYATSGNTGRYSTAQIYNISGTNYAVVQRRTRIRGTGLSLQIKFKSVSGQPFDFIGWSTFETQNMGV